MNKLDALVAMFEELKASLSEIKTQLEASRMEKNGKTQQENKSVDSSENMESSIQKHITDRLVELYNLLKDRVNKTETELKDYILSNLAKQQHIHKHIYTIDLKSSKVPAIILGLGISLLISLYAICNMYKYTTELEDNDWKYRYIKSIKGIDKKQLGDLENIFEYNRNDSTISELKDFVVRYENALSKKAQNLEKHELMD